MRQTTKAKPVKKKATPNKGKSPLDIPEIDDVVDSIDSALRSVRAKKAAATRKKKAAKILQAKKKAALARKRRYANRKRIRVCVCGLESCGIGPFHWIYG